MPKSRKVLRRLAVSEKVGLSPVQVWRKANDPDDDFPEARILGPNSTGWFEDELDVWLESRPRGGGQRKAHFREHLVVLHVRIAAAYRDLLNLEKDLTFRRFRSVDVVELEGLWCGNSCGSH